MNTMTSPTQPSPNARQDAVQRGVDAYRENHARAGISVHRIIDRVLIAAGYDELTAAHAELVAEVARLKAELSARGDYVNEQLLQRAEAAERERDHYKARANEAEEAAQFWIGEHNRMERQRNALRAELAELAQRAEAGARDEREACAQVCNAMVDLPLSEIPAATAFGRLYEAGIRHGLVAATNAIRARAAIDSAAEGKAS